MFHDLVAELSGYRAELATAIQAEDAERERAVRAELDRVQHAIAAQARQHHTEAEGHDVHGQPGLAAAARQRAADLEAALPADLASATPPAANDAAQSIPKETAVTRRGRSKES